MIISVGYRVNSKQGIIFRKWATKILKDYMIKGYAINQKRLEYLEKTVKLIDIASRIDDNLLNSDAKEILKLIAEYSKALNILDDYDNRNIKKTDGTISNKKITYQECKNIIKHHYTPTSLMGKFQKICIVYLPFCLYKKLAKKIAIVKYDASQNR
jgi:hypothetical protein